MGIENEENREMFEQPIEHPVAKIPETEQPEQKEVSPDKRKLAEKTVFDTLEIERDKSLENFDDTLREATKSLPRYQQIEQILEGIERQNLPHELFKALRKASDDAEENPNAPKDGVLIKSMRRGRLECAGRTLIASIFLQEHNIDHTVVSAPGHALIIIEQSPDTLAYFDANNNLYFTFPRSALDGFKGIEASAECRLQEYVPREEDFADGVNTVFSHFVAMPAKEAIGRQYLGNVAAALNGNKEFETSGIAINNEAAEATHQIESEIYGDNPVLDSFYSRVEALIEKEERQTEEDKRVIGEILQDHPTRNNFVAAFSLILDGNFGDRVPYVKNAPVEQKRMFAEKVWDYLQKRNIDEAITGR